MASPAGAHNVETGSTPCRHGQAGSYRVGYREQESILSRSWATRRTVSVPKTHRIVDRKEFLTILQRIYDDLIEEHSREIRAIGGRIPVGGNGWADPFFKAEGIRSVINAIHGGRSVSGAIEVGKTVSTISVQLWNKNRSYHIQRWEKTAHDFIENTVWSLYKAQGGKV